MVTTTAITPSSAPATNVPKTLQPWEDVSGIMATIGFGTAFAIILWLSYLAAGAIMRAVKDWRDQRPRVGT